MSPADDTLLSDSLKNVFIEDGYRLALESFLSEDPANNNIIEIPDSLFKDFYNGLIHIYNTASAERDSIFDRYFIHSAPEPVFHEFIVILDSTPSWLEKWMYDITPVGNQLVDSLLQNYSLEILSYSESTIDNWLLLNCNQFNNILALANLFKELDHVTNVSPNVRGNYDGFWSKDIQAKKENDSIVYKFIYINDEFKSIGPWYFSVKYDGEVIYRGKSMNLE